MNTALTTPVTLQPRGLPKVMKCRPTLRGVFVPDLSPSLIPWERLSRVRPGSQRQVSQLLWPSDESGAPLMNGKRLVAISCGDTSKAKSLVRRLVARARWNAFRAGRLTLEGEVGSARRHLLTPLLLVTLVGLVALSALVLLRLQPPDDFLAYFAMAACLAMWTGFLIGEIADARKKPVYATWLRVEPGSVSWRTARGQVTHRPVSPSLAAELSRLRYIPTHEVGRVVRDIQAKLSPRRARLSALATLWAIVAMFVRLGSPFVLIALYMPLLANAFGATTTATRLRGMILLGLTPIVTASLMLTLRFAASRGRWRWIRARARRSRAHRKASGRE